MRRKRRLEERIAACDRHLLYLEPVDFYKNAEDEKYRVIDYFSVFGNGNPVWLDLGCGKGNFAIELAEKRKDINIIGVEKISNVLIEGLEKVKELNPDNCMFLNCCVENLKYYLEKHSVSGIYLNFSCPFPKNTYKNRRLTYKRYLELYKYLLKKDGYICLKTDNMKFFEYSLESFSECGFKLRNVSLDLHNSDFKDNIQTDYEKIFSQKGLPIYRVEAYI